MSIAQAIDEKNKLQSPPTELLKECVANALGNYFTQLDGEMPRNVYEMVLNEIEAPLFKVVMEFTQGNQSKAAELLGLSRGTLRKKLQAYGLLT